MIFTDVVTVGTTPTLIASSPRRGLDDVHWVEVVVAAGGNDVFVGGVNVTVDDGRPIHPTGSVEASWSATLGPEDSLYAVVEADTEDVRIIRSREPV